MKTQPGPIVISEHDAWNIVYFSEVITAFIIMGNMVAHLGHIMI